VKSKAISVKCWCGWRGRRTQHSCDCIDPCSHTGFGCCPKCHYQVQSVEWLRQRAKDAAAYDIWAASPEGKAALEQLFKATEKGGGK
jgi:hypothetical protein